MKSLKNFLAGFVVAVVVLCGSLTTVGYAQARASTTTGVITIRSILSGALTFGGSSSATFGTSATFGWADAMFSRDAAGKVALKTNGANTVSLREYYGGGTNFISNQIDSNINHNFNATEKTPGAPTAALNVVGGQNCTAGAHLFKITFITAGGETDAGTASGSVTCDGTHTTVALSAIPVGSQVVTGRNVYATKAGQSTYFLVSTSPVISNNTATTYTFNTADASLTATTAPTTNTAVDTRVTFNNAGQVITLAGAIGSPSLAIANSNTDGFYSPSGHNIRLVINGADKMQWGSVVTVFNSTLAVGDSTGANAFQMVRQASGSFNLVDNGGTSGVNVNVATDGIFKLFARDGTSAASLTVTGALTCSGSSGDCTSTRDYVAGRYFTAATTGGFLFNSRGGIASLADGSVTFVSNNGTVASQVSIDGYSVGSRTARGGVKTVLASVTLSGATTATTNFIPAGSTVEHCTTTTTTTITGATGYTVGDGSDADRYGSVTGTAVGTHTGSTDETADPRWWTNTARAITLTALTSNFTGGVVQVVCILTDATGS